THRRPPARHERRTGLYNREPRVAVAMLSPAGAVIVVVALFPVLYSIFLSFRTATVNSSGHWAGLHNYLDLLTDPEFRTALANTAVFTVVSVAVEFGIGLGMALALHRAFRLRGLARTAILIPWAFPVVVSAMMWRLMLTDQVGVVAWIVRSIGLSDRPIL